MSGDVCFYEIVFKGRYGEQTKLIQDDDFEAEMDLTEDAMTAAKHFVVPNSKILGIYEKCGYELLEHINDMRHSHGSCLNIFIPLYLLIADLIYISFEIYL